MDAIKRQAAYTLVELVTTVGILAIISSMAYQGWGAWAESNRHRTILEQYNTLFSYARWTAASTHSLVTLCPLSGEGKCIDDWKLPVSVFRDTNNDKKPDGGEILQQLTPVKRPYSIRSRTAGRGYFQFNERGFAYGALGSLVLCPTAQSKGIMSYMAINMAGRFRVQSDEDGDRSIKLSWGTIINC